MKTPRYRVWAPAETPVRIEYSVQVVRKAARHERGVLYGVRQGVTIRVTAARAKPDPSLSKLELLGTFAFRPRGEIFLTESDLEHLERADGSLALVVAGTKAGFFVYEPDGSIQTIRSFREFSILERPPEPKPRWDRRKLWIPLGSLAVLAACLAPGPRARPLALSVREDAHQLRISWTPHVFESARLEIFDGTARTWIPVPADSSGVTYVPLTSDVRVRLTAGSRTESAHFVGIDPSPDIARLERLESEAAQLRTQLATTRKRAANLQARIQRTLAELNR